MALALLLSLLGHGTPIGRWLTTPGMISKRIHKKWPFESEAADSKPRDKSTRDCEICGSSASQAFRLRSGLVAQPVLHVFLCRACGLLFVGDDLSDEVLKEAYRQLRPADYYRSIETTTLGKVDRAIADLEPILANRRPPPAVLDVGCGFGHLLHALCQRYPEGRILGQEFDEANAIACRSQGLDVSTADLQDLEGPFAAVVMLDVLEHVQHAPSFLASVRALAEEDGTLYIHTPRRCFWDSLSLALVAVPLLRHIALSWLRTRVSVYHLRLWSDRALQHALVSRGFTVVSFSRELELSWPIERYCALYLGEILRVPSAGVKAVAFLAKVVFVRLRLLRNKAIVLARVGQQAA